MMCEAHWIVNGPGDMIARYGRRREMSKMSRCGCPGGRPSGRTATAPVVVCLVALASFADGHEAVSPTPRSRQKGAASIRPRSFRRRRAPRPGPGRTTSPARPARNARDARNPSCTPQERWHWPQCPPTPRSSLDMLRCSQTVGRSSKSHRRHQKGNPASSCVSTDSITSS